MATEPLDGYKVIVFPNIDAMFAADKALGERWRDAGWRMTTDPTSDPPHYALRVRQDAPIEANDAAGETR